MTYPKSMRKSRVEKNQDSALLTAICTVFYDFARETFRNRICTFFRDSREERLKQSAQRGGNELEFLTHLALRTDPGCRARIIESSRNPATGVPTLAYDASDDDLVAYVLQEAPLDDEIIDGEFRSFTGQLVSWWLNSLSKVTRGLSDGTVVSLNASLLPDDHTPESVYSLSDAIAGPGQMFTPNEPIEMLRAALDAATAETRELRLPLRMVLTRTDTGYTVAKLSAPDAAPSQ